MNRIFPDPQDHLVAKIAAILNMRLRNLRKLEEMQIRAEDKALRTVGVVENDA